MEDIETTRTGQVKGSTNLFKFVKALVKVESPAFQQQEKGLQLFLYAWRYDDRAMNDYTQHGFFPHLTQASF
jgi:hypothetical protein